MRKFFGFSAILLAFSLGAPTASAQFQLSTVWNGNTYFPQGSCIYFDVVVANSVQITALDCNYIETAGAAVGVNVYITPGSYIGNTTNQSVWTLVATDDGTAVAAGRGQPSHCNLATPFILAPGNYGMALTHPAAGHYYTQGNGTNQTYSDSYLTLNLGASQATPFSSGLASPRVWNGTIHYGPGCAGAATISGQGCNDSTGTPVRMSSSGCPDVNTLFTISVATGAAMTSPIQYVMGVSDQVWLGIQLPLDLGLVGATGCSLYTSQEFSLILPNPGGGADLPIPIPNWSGLVGGTSYWQGLAIDPGANALGVVASDYMTVVIG